MLNFFFQSHYIHYAISPFIYYVEFESLGLEYCLINFRKLQPSSRMLCFLELPELHISHLCKCWQQSC